MRAISSAILRRSEYSLSFDFSLKISPPFRFRELKDEDKINTLQEHAKKRGLELSKSVGHYILNRCARNMHDLQTVLDRLDHASLVAQRKLTIPFVKDVLGV